MEERLTFPDNPVRRNPIRYSDAKEFLIEGSIDIETLVDEFRCYRDDDFRIVMRRENNETFEDKNYAILGSKRGNKVYNYRIRRRLEPIRKYPNIEFFNYKDRSHRHKTKAIFIDYTYQRAISLSESWEKIGIDLNRQLSRLYSKYGKFSLFRTFEAQKDGYAHIHAILIFENYEFETFFYNGNWRIQERDELVWSEGFSDILALSNTRGGLRYVSKYMAKSYTDTPSPKEELTQALMWAFHKRSYSVSGDFLDLIRTLSNSNTKELTQLDLSLNPVPNRIKWRLIGFYRGFLGDDWFKEITLDEIQEMRNSSSFFEPKSSYGGDFQYQ
jgi:hypothetical protein